MHADRQLATIEGFLQLVRKVVKTVNSLQQHKNVKFAEKEEKVRKERLRNGEGENRERERERERQRH